MLFLLSGHDFEGNCSRYYFRRRDMDRSEKRKMLHGQRLISLPLFVYLKVWLHMFVCVCVLVCVSVSTQR